MPEFTIPFGKTTLTAKLPEKFRISHITPNQIPPVEHPIETVRAALEQPVGDLALSDFSHPASVAIAINDKTRPVPHKELLPPLLERLEQRGVDRENITFIIATGLHPPMLPEEFPSILPQNIIERYRVISHDAKDTSSLQYLGVTERKTPVWSNRVFMEADLRIVVGNIEPHQFMGFSGGVKSAAIGLAGAKTINHNHSMMTQPTAALGQYDDNPARADVEAIGKMMDIHFALNAILNGEKEIVKALAGEPQAVIKAGIPLVRDIYEVPVEEAVDVLIVSPGGHPKDINVYQMQKGLAHAVRITKPNAIVILVAACPEGAGSDTYEKWMEREDMVSHEAVLHRFADEGFKVGPHKAYQLSRDGSKVHVLFVSQMDPDLARKLLLHPIPSLDEAISIAIRDLPADAHIGVMPVANATIPVLKPQA